LLKTKDSAKYPGMPHSAVAAGVVNFALPPKKIVEELMRVGKHPYLNHTGLKVVKLEVEEEEKDSFRSIMAILRLAYGVDFSAYKESTVNRRLSMRMVVNQIEKIEDYVNLLRSNKTEMESLFNDLLIGVTSFFREPEAFNILTNKIFPAIFKDKNSKATVRVWALGCSTGEEVYSIAICLSDYLEKNGINVNVQIFGTDVSERNIEKARAGIYPETIDADVYEARLKRFFSRVNHHYQIAKTIRDMCVFAKQDLTRDPPFSNLDIVSCLNVLIYFKTAVQRRIIPLFHYALKDGGFLLLGKSESVGAFTDLFSPLNNDIAYVKKSVPNKAHFGMVIPPPLSPKEIIKADFAEKPMTQLESEVERILMDNYAPWRSGQRKHGYSDFQREHHTLHFTFSGGSNS
jgi:two-component system CheB/CheR fusion protein